MKNTLALFLFFIIFLGCKEVTTEASQSNISYENKSVSSNENMSTAELIAYANGFENWKNVNEISFTFNVDRDSSHFERSWIWNPKSADIVLIANQDTIAFNRNQIDSLNLKSDQAFINDKYWLLAPFNLIWDEGTSFVEKSNVLTPITKDTLDQLTILYSNEGGYTPGDAYDFYFGKDFIITEWVFREGNDSIPTMTLTWEDYKTFNGIHISTMHADSNRNLKIYFTNITVK